MIPPVYRCALALSILLPGCQTGTGALAPVTLVDEAGAPCPGAGTYDAARIIAMSDERAQARADYAATYYKDVIVPPEAESAATRIRVRVPATGMHPADTRLVLWKEEGGTWQVADSSKNHAAPPPMPKPVFNEAGEIIGAEFPEEVPYVAGAMNEERAAQLDALLASKCFREGPDSLPYEAPLRAPAGAPNPFVTCPPDAAGYAAELVQPG